VPVSIRHTEAGEQQNLSPLDTNLRFEPTAIPVQWNPLKPGF